MSKIQKNQSDDSGKTKKTKVDKEIILELVKTGKSDKEIAELMGVSIRSVMRVRIAANVRRQRGGARPGAGRKRKHHIEIDTDVTIEELRRQQIIDTRVNSLEVGIGRKILTHEDIFRWASSAYVADRNGRYIRVEPCDLPRVLKPPAPLPTLEMTGNQKIRAAQTWGAVQRA